MNSSTQPPRLLVADDEIEIGEIIKAVAEDLGFEVVCVTSGLEVVPTVEKFQPDVITLDLRMPGADGVEIIRKLGSNHCKANILLISGMDQRTLSSVQSLGLESNLKIAGTLTKPMSLDVIESSLSPFLTSQTREEIKPEQAQPDFDFGLSIRYEPEFQLCVLGETKIQRLRVHPQWRKDDNTILGGEQFLSWVHGLGISHGTAKMAMADALEALRIWSNQDFSPEITFTFDPLLLADLAFPDILSAMTDSSFVPRELVIIEVDEASLISKQSGISDVLSRLRIKGFKISVRVDAEGEKILPMIDTLPIDQLLVDLSPLLNKPDLASNMELEFLYSSFVSVANRKGISVCATKVDSVEQYNFAKRCKFNSTRGSQISMPLLARDILPLYTKGKFSDQLSSDQQVSNI